MRKVILILICIITVSIINAQGYSSIETTSDNSFKENVSDLGQDAPTYQLFKTDNVWNFIKLNTRNGLMWQVQFDVEGNNRFETFLNLLPLVGEKEEINGRFNLYPTQNTWNFLLLDQVEGKVWQVQWSMEPENRIVLPID